MIAFWLLMLVIDSFAEYRDCSPLNWTWTKSWWTIVLNVNKNFTELQNHCLHQVVYTSTSKVFFKIWKIYFYSLTKCTSKLIFKGWKIFFVFKNFFGSISCHFLAAKSEATFSDFDRYFYYTSMRLKIIKF